MWKWIAGIGGVVALVVVLVIGLGQAESPTASGGSRYRSPEAAAKPLAGATGTLKALYAQPSEVLQGDIRDRLRELRGQGVVVNKWASWCGPCRAEFPFFQQVGAKLGTQVAFLGLNSGDNAADARKFLTRFPLGWPSYEDPRERAAVKLGAGSNYPITLFYGRTGERTYIHQGGYVSGAQLEADVRRYALGAGAS
jgi:thiol-disulfide isomerase/thioredoxin